MTRIKNKLYIGMAIIFPVLLLFVIFTNATNTGCRSSTCQTITTTTSMNTTTIPQGSSTSVSTSITTTISNNPPAPQVMVNLITWNQNNGYSRIQWQNITEVSVFHMQLEPGCTWTYDGSSVNVPQVIATAHQYGVKVTLAFGGSKINLAELNACMSTKQNRTVLINGMIGQIAAQGYDGAHIDFEGTFNPAYFTLFMQEFSSALWSQRSGAIIDVMVANWYSSSFDLAAIAPYATHFGYMFNPSSGNLANFAGQLGSNSKLSACYDLDPGQYTPTLAQLQRIRQAGYGVCIWQANLVTPQFYGYLGSLLR